MATKQTKLDEYKAIFNYFAEGSSSGISAPVLLLTTKSIEEQYDLQGPILKFLMRNNIDIDIINTAHEFVNSHTRYITLNRFIEMMQLISIMQSNPSKIDEIKNKIESTDHFIHIEYVFIPDPEHDAISIPLQLYELKIPKTATITLFKQEVKKKHNISDEDYLFVCDIWKNKVHRELRKHDECNDYKRKHDDYIIYHKKKIEIIPQLKQRENTKINAFVVNFYKTEKKSMSDIDEYIGFPLVFNVFEDRMEIKMNELYTRLCKMIYPLVNDDLLQWRFNLVFNTTIKTMNDIVFGFLRRRFEEKYEIEMPPELKLLVMNYSKFNIPKDLPFKIYAKWINDGIMEIVDKDEIVDLDVKNIKFEILFSDSTKMNTECWMIRNRKQVGVDCFDENVPSPVSYTDIQMLI